MRMYNRQVKLTYSETTVNKEKSDQLKSAAQVLAMYNCGQLRAPCVRLQCIGFDSTFYQELVRANDQFYTNKPRPGPPGAGAKRRKIGGEQPKDDNEDTTAKSISPGSSDAAPLRWLSESTLTPLCETPSRSVSVAVPALGEVPEPSATPAATAVTAVSVRTTTATSGQRESSGSGRLTLRIPSRPFTRSPTKSPDAQVEEAEVEIELSESDDDDLYLSE